MNRDDKERLKASIVRVVDFQAFEKYMSQHEISVLPETTLDFCFVAYMVGVIGDVVKGRPN